MPPLERLLMGQCGGKLGSFLTPLTPIYLPVHPEKPFYKITNSGILYQILFKDYISPLQANWVVVSVYHLSQLRSLFSAEQISHISRAVCGRISRTGHKSRGRERERTHKQALTDPPTTTV